MWMITEVDYGHTDANYVTYIAHGINCHKHECCGTTGMVRSVKDVEEKK
jgi:hypothetical protein